MYWNVQPVSSYGRGLAGAKLCTEKYMSAKRAIRLIAADDVVAGLDVEAAASGPCAPRVPGARSSLTACAASALRYCVAGITQP